ncbi:MAG: efflux RND transporter periplasmic adaptor subunit [Vicinamibacterales bacterium]
MSPEIDRTAAPGSQAPAPDPAVSRRTLRTIGVAAVVVLGVLLLAGLLPRLAREERQQTAASPAAPRVSVAAVKRGPAEVELALPASIQAMVEAPLYARAEGYVRRRLVDIGDLVTRDQLLAEISSPEFDQQVLESEASLRRSRSAQRQAESQLGQSVANLRLAEVTAERWQTLVGKGVLSKQDGDEKRTTLAARQADEAAARAAVQSARESVGASEAALARLGELQAFRQIRAPFDGRVTARGIDIGSLVNPGSGTAARELFRVAQVGRLRAQIQIPQGEAPSVQAGMACELSVREFPKTVFPGVVTRTAGALDPVSRTMLAEIELENPGAVILPGMYATVVIRVTRKAPPVMIPAGALRTGAGGPSVAIVDAGNVVRFRKVSLGRDLGAQIEVVQGLEPGTKVVTTVTDAVRDGAIVTPVVQAGAPGQGPGGAQPSTQPKTK